MSDPDASAASTTSTPRASPLIRRLRRGKFVARGGVPGGNSDTSPPRAAIRCARSRLRAGIDAIEARADDRERRRRAVQGACVRRRVDAERQSRHDREARVGQRAREVARVVDALRRGVAAADDRQRGPVQELAPADVVQHRRRMAELEQRPRIVGVVPGDQVVAGLRQPRVRARERVGGDRGGQPRGDRVGHHRGPLRAGRREDRLRAAERAQQRDERGRRQRAQRQRGPGFAVRGNGIHGATMDRPRRRGPSDRQTRRCPGRQALRGARACARSRRDAPGPSC